VPTRTSKSAAGNRKSGAATTRKRSGATSRQTASQNRHFEQISSATSEIVKQAGAVLDEEMAIGIVTAKQMQDRFDQERRLDTGDFQEALQRFQNDGHELVNLVDQQVVELRSDENIDLTNRLISNVHNLLDLAVGLVSTGTEIANQLIERNLPKTEMEAEKPKTAKK
jgi:hypothetical protein